ncbi:hypothetical protein [Comamonas sp.]|uniref:hypothetical protein n=1 Tax=Comamonas sp. TaxID=34028 RepID=UPI0028A03252|nr:hypothetical protein [Comamonas sp.]
MSSAAQLIKSPLAAPFTGGVCDLSKRSYFADTVAGAINFTFVNRPADCVTFEVEINLVSGTIAWPANVRWVGGTAPQNLQTGKIHVFQFRRPQATGADQWLGSYLPNY